TFDINPGNILLCLCTPESIMQIEELDTGLSIFREPGRTCNGGIAVAIMLIELSFTSLMVVYSLTILKIDEALILQVIEQMPFPNIRLLASEDMSLISFSKFST